MNTRTAAVSALLAVATATVLAGCGADDTAPTDTTAMTTSGTGAVLAQAELVDPSGARQGTVTFTEAGDSLDVTVEATGLTPGFHGFHIHAVGECEPDSPDPADPAKTGDFLSSGGHLAGEDEAEHPDHAGDLPALLVGADGEGRLTARTDRLTGDLLLDADGSAVIIHGGADNYANIPDRYAAAGADEETRKAGDAGAREMCGVVQAP